MSVRGNIEQAFSILAAMNGSKGLVSPMDQSVAVKTASRFARLESVRNKYGESPLELASRLKASQACIDLMDLGADPFEPPRCVDEHGALARLRPFESFIAHDLASCIERACSGRDVAFIERQALAWRNLQAMTHPQIRVWRLGSCWGHLCAACESLSALRALSAAMPSDFLLKRDSTGSGPLMACAKTRRTLHACAQELMLMGADPWEINDRGERPADNMPDSWPSLGTRALAGILDKACRHPDSMQDGARSPNRL